MELLRGFKSVLGAQNEETEQSGSETVCTCIFTHIFVEKFKSIIVFCNHVELCSYVIALITAAIYL
jgi:hypothetical protein